MADIIKVHKVYIIQEKIAKWSSNEHNFQIRSNMLQPVKYSK